MNSQDNVSAFLRVFAAFFLICICALSLEGCALYHLREENKIVYGSTILVGTITYPLLQKTAPIVVAAYSKSGNTRTIAHYTVIREPGPYELIVPTGQWYLVAFEDDNQDYALQKGEAAGQLGKNPLAVTRTGGVVLDLNIMLQKTRQKDFDFPEGTAVTVNKPQRPHFTSPGTVCSLDDPLFKEENGVEGFWQPVEFFRKFGGNVYFLEPYDPQKIPILFVHGATGTPAGWKYLVDRIDRKHFQPWFYYYPSGASIKAMGDLLFWKLYSLKNKYHFKKMYLVAHSMGGLVVRSFLVEYGRLFPEIGKFVSISTPWNGDSLAAEGVKYSPGVIPAWRDMVPQSEFAQSIFRRKFPPGIEYFLFFGYKGNRNPLRPNNDGVVTMATQLDPRIQQEAKMVYGFNEDHNSILTNGHVADIFENVIGEGDNVPGNLPHPSTGRLGIVFSRILSPDPENVWAQIQLLPKDRSITDSFLLNVNVLESGRSFGPFPAGEYTLRMWANGFRSKPLDQVVTIDAKHQEVVSFELVPYGSINGYVHRQFYKDADPAGVYMVSDPDLIIRSISLSGKGIKRTVFPIQKEPFDPFELYRNGIDWVYKNAFAFYNVPMGTYTLTVRADGATPYSEQYKITPARPGRSTLIVLPR